MRTIHIEITARRPWVRVWLLPWSAMNCIAKLCRVAADLYEKNAEAKQPRDERGRFTKRRFSEEAP